MTDVRTFTLDDQEHEAAIRAVLLGLQDQLDAARHELDAVVSSERVTSTIFGADFAEHFERANATMGVLRRFGWPAHEVRSDG